MALGTTPSGGHEKWSSNLIFVMAAVGSAVGLGNIWRFPTLAGESGGGAFVLIYIICVILIGTPILMAEIAIGRRGGMSPVASMKKVALEEGRSPAWRWLGWAGVLTGLFGLTAYTTLAGFALDYVFKAATGLFQGVGGDASKAIFEDHKHNTSMVVGWHLIFVAVTVFVVALGLRRGIEKAVQLLMPGLLVILLILVGYSMVTADLGAALEFMFAFKMSDLTPAVFLHAIGQVFFSLSIGIGAMMTYGAYLDGDTNVPRLAGTIAAADTAIAMLAGLAIFPLVFSFGLQPGSGEGLVFETLPVAFGQMPGGQIFGTLFFLLLTFAALTTSISMLEPMVSYLEEHKGFNRPRTTVMVGAFIAVVGLASALSFNEWETVFPLGFIPMFEKYTIFRLIDFFDANVLNTLGGMFIAIFAGWFMGRSSTMAMLGFKGSHNYGLWRFLMRWIAPIAVLAIFIQGMGLI